MTAATTDLDRRRIGFLARAHAAEDILDVHITDALLGASCGVFHDALHAAGVEDCTDEEGSAADPLALRIQAEWLARMGAMFIGRAAATAAANQQGGKYDGYLAERVEREALEFARAKIAEANGDA